MLSKVLFLLFLLIPSYVQAVPTLISSVAVTNDSLNSATSKSSSVTTGAGIIVIVVSHDQSVPSYTVTDSLGNVYLSRTNYASTAEGAIQIWYVLTPITSGTTDFTIFTSGGIPSGVMMAFGDVTSYELENGATNGAGSSLTLATGAVSSSYSNVLLISGATWTVVGVVTIDSSFTIAQQAAFVNGFHYGVGGAYKIITTAASQNPTWTFPTTSTNAVDIASFKSSASTLPGANSCGNFLLLNVGC